MTNVHRSIAPALSIALVLALTTLPAGAPRAAKRLVPAPRDTAMVLIPAGEFVMGREGTGDNSPPHTVRLSAFHLDRYEVTNAEYEAFCKATGRRLPEFWGTDLFRSGPKYPDHPVVFGSNSDARDYATWRGKRLPTEAEWECAARGGLAGMQYVGGNTLDSSEVNFTLSGRKGSVPVGSFAPNGYGLYDMAGNVQEWVADRYGAEYYKNSPAEAPPGPAGGRHRVIRGGVRRERRLRREGYWPVLDFDGLDAEAFQFLGQIAQGIRAVPKGMAGRLLFHALQHRRYPVGADVGAGALAVVRQPHGLLRILVADGGIQQDELVGGVVEQGGEHLAHQFLVVQRNVPQLLPVQDYSLIYHMHVLIVPPAGGANHPAKTSDG